LRLDKEPHYCSPSLLKGHPLTEYIVIYNRGVTARIKPNTQADETQTFAQGQSFEGYDRTEIGDQHWVRITTDDDVTQEYVCVQIGSHIIAQEVNDNFFPRVEWVQAVDSWIRIQGYKGPKP
jgi:hypothetical protein